MKIGIPLSAAHLGPRGELSPDSAGRGCSHDRSQDSRNVVSLLGPVLLCFPPLIGRYAHLTGQAVVPGNAVQQRDLTRLGGAAVLALSAERWNVAADLFQQSIEHADHFFRLRLLHRVNPRNQEAVAGYFYPFRVEE